MFFMQNFKGFPDALNLIFPGAQGFFPAKRAFCPFCHIYARALSPKINIPQATQTKINIFLGRISRTFQCCIDMSTYRVFHTVFSPPNVYFRLVSQFFFLKSDLQATCYFNVYQSSKMLYFRARNLGMRFKLRFYHSTQWSVECKN